MKPFGLNMRFIDKRDKKKEQTFLDGKLHGVEKWWTIKGFLEAEIQYKNGKKHGLSRVYILKKYIQYTETNYENGIKQGLETRFCNGKKEYDPQNNPKQFR